MSDKELIDQIYQNQFMKLFIAIKHRNTLQTQTPVIRKG